MSFIYFFFKTRKDFLSTGASRTLMIIGIYPSEGKVTRIIIFLERKLENLAQTPVQTTLLLNQRTSARHPQCVTRLVIFDLSATVIFQKFCNEILFPSGVCSQ